MKERRFRKLQSMLTDSGERESMEKHFIIGDDGRRRFTPPADKRTAKRINGILVKVRKARSGPRTVRIVLLLIIIGAPVIFNIFFLDIMASRQLEKALESFTRTDVGVKGLDISVLRGRTDLGVLSFASDDDEMKDALVFSGLALDFRLTAFLQRRINIETLTGELAFNRDREYPAEYPENRESKPEDHETEKATGPGLDWMPIGELPSSSVDLARRLAADARSDADAWRADLDEDLEEAEDLIARCTGFVNQPLPAKTDISGWKVRIDEGRELTDELKAMESLVDDYSARMDRSLSLAVDAPAQVRAAMAEDLAAMEENFIPDADMVNKWLAAALEAYVGPRAAGLYARGNSLRTRFGSLSSGSDSPGESGKSGKSGNTGRMKSGRIVPFPVNRPPRFTIGILDLRSGESRISGKNVGVDHDLAGVPSEMAAILDGIPGLPGRLEADVVVDGRKEAVTRGEGRLKLQGAPWNVESDGSGASGNMNFDGRFSMPAGTENAVVTSGTVSMYEWGDGSGSLDFLKAGAPDLDFNYEAVYDGEIKDLGISIDRSAIGPWAGLLAESFLPVGTDEARKELEEAVGMEQAGLDSVIAGWEGRDGELSGLDGALAAAEEELDSLLEDMLAQTGVDLPGGLDAGSAGDAVDDALGGLKKLF